MHVNVVCDVTARYQESEHSATLAERRNPLLVTVGVQSENCCPLTGTGRMRKPAFSKAERHSRQKQVTRQRQKLLVSFSWDQPTFKNLSVYWMQMGIRVQTGVQSLEVLPDLSPCALDLSGTRCSQPRWARDCRLRGRWGRWGRAARRTRWAPRGCLCPPAAGPPPCASPRLVYYARGRQFAFRPGDPSRRQEGSLFSVMASAGVWRREQGVRAGGEPGVGSRERGQSAVRRAPPSGHSEPEASAEEANSFFSTLLSAAFFASLAVSFVSPFSLCLSASCSLSLT